MNKYLIVMMVAIIGCFSNISLAETSISPSNPEVQSTTTQTPIAPLPKPRYRYGIFDVNCGAPSGCVGEMGIRPWYWLKLEVGAGYNAVAPGVIGSVILDPIPFGFGLSLSADAGHFWGGPLPFLNNPPNVEYSFADALLGLEFGNYRVFRFYLRGGITYLDATVSNFNTSNNANVIVGDIRATGYVAPAIKLGWTIYF